MRHSYRGVEEKRRDLWVAFSLWLVINGLVSGLLLALSAFSTPPGEGARPRFDATIPAIVLGLVNVGVAAVAGRIRAYVP